MEQAGDSLKSTSDSVAGTLQPEGDKSTTQKMSDSTSSGANDASKQGDGMLKQAQDSVNSGLQSASDALGLSGENSELDLTILAQKLALTFPGREISLSSHRLKERSRRRLVVHRLLIQ